MQDLSCRNVPVVSVLPAASAALAGAVVRFATDNKPYWCNGTGWYPMPIVGDDGKIPAVQQSDPVLPNSNGAIANPAAGYSRLFGRSMAYRNLPGYVESYDTNPSLLQALLGSKKIAWWNPPGNATTVPGVLGIAAPTAVGTATARSAATTSMATRMRRLGYVSAATAGSLAGHYNTAAQFTMGSPGTVNMGGFFYQCRFVTSDAANIPDARMFVGLSSSVAAPTNVDPATLTNCIGIAQQQSSTNLVIVNGGSAEQTPVSLGANFPGNGLSADAYELTLYCPAGTYGWAGYRVERLNTGHVAEGLLSAATPGLQLPNNTTLMAHRAWRCNNTTAVAAGIDIASVYIETDF